MNRLFGTDGVRGVANQALTAELALQLGEAAGRELGGAKIPHPRLVVARDTRISGQMLEAALAAGITSAGCDVLACGILPTPAVAFLVRHWRTQGGVVISGSHNPYGDNGIKFFGSDGFKLDDETEKRIEDRVRSRGPRPTGAGLGRILQEHQGEQLYVDHALAALEGQSLRGKKVVVDCANGAAYRTSPQAFRRAGAEVIVTNDVPDGLNINARCGSMWPEGLAEQVTRSEADIGLAYDGDADRVIAVDENGDIVDGDAMLAMLALELRDLERLTGNVVVSTVMANLGFRHAMARAGIELVETPVGDRYVIEAMRRRGASIGGEQSGHIVTSSFSTTGDGLVTGLRLTRMLASTGQNLSSLSTVVERFPQVLVNVEVKDRQMISSSIRIRAAIEEAERSISGRVLVRPSGTEPVVRVMVEATDADAASAAAHSIAAAIRGEN
jgi:phosphoglucosamine mutase